MKFLHLSDLHLGKAVHEFSMIEDQEYILKKIIGIVDEELPQCVLIAGDVFDRTIASTDALRLLDDFLVALAKRGVQVFLISGNHDSADRLSFGARLIAESGIHIARGYDGEIAKYTVSDAYGDVDIYLLPFLKPAHVRRFFPETEIGSWTDALDAVIKALSVDPARRKVIVAHQFVTGAIRCESEEINVGGADNVDARVFDSFDYVALGHLHGAQSVGRETARYCGTPLKYSFSEAAQSKSVSVVELAEKGNVTIRAVPLVPQRDMREIKGTYLEVTAKEFYKDLNLDDYYRITLTDEEDQPDALGKLRIIYPNLMRLDYDNKRTQKQADFSGSVDVTRFTPFQLFESFFEEQNGRTLSDVQQEYLNEVIEKVWEEVR